jgi:O-antigen/teichoic acid export membrane protein
MYGVLDYVSYPLGMLLVAPVILRRLGAAEYGLWMVATAVISAGGIIASGFCDANIQRVATYRGISKHSSLVHTVRSMLAINLTLGFAVAIAVWIAAPYAAQHIAGTQSPLLKECLICLRIAGVMILIRAIETVSVSTQRAFETYNRTVQISSAIRLFTLSSAAVLAWFGKRTESIMLATAVFLVLGTCLQLWHLRKFIGNAPLWPIFQRLETRVLLRTGVFVWFQALGSVIFRQLDRILLGVSLGAAAVAPYSLCIQLAEPLFGLTASGLSFLFPYLSRRAGNLSDYDLKRTIQKVFVCNLLLVLCGAAILLYFGDRFLKIWAGATVAHDAIYILPLAIAASALSGISVTGIYAMQALGRFRMVACISLASRSGLLLLMVYLLRHDGLHGLAIARVYFGAASLLVYLPLIKQLAIFTSTKNSISSSTIIKELQGGANL